ncbi:MAG TPA: hypothetical protein DCY20_00990 [Firmicutes bacterium]|nr:hypothetical protein [Bacillota bacterium]
MFNQTYPTGGMYNAQSFFNARDLYHAGQFSQMGAAQGLSGLGNMKSIPPWVSSAGKFYMQNPKMVHSVLKSGKDVFFNNGNGFGGRGYTDVNVDKNVNIDHNYGGTGFGGFGGLTSLIIGGIAGYALANAGNHGGAYPAPYPQPVPTPYPYPYPSPQQASAPYSNAPTQMPYSANQPYVTNPNTVPNMQGPIPTINQGSGQSMYHSPYPTSPYPPGIQINQGVPNMQGQQMYQGAPSMQGQQMYQGVPSMQGQQMYQGTPNMQNQPVNQGTTPQQSTGQDQNPAYKEYHTYEVFQNGQKTYAQNYQYPYPYYDTNK